MEDEIRKEIEAILSRVELNETSTQGVQAFINVAQMITAFVLECVVSGLTRSEGIDLACSYLNGLASKPSDG